MGSDVLFPKGMANKKDLRRRFLELTNEDMRVLQNELNRSIKASENVGKKEGFWHDGGYPASALMHIYN
ncbi:MAG: hypothetical protein J6O73_09525 [Lachnospiraceae bacterium]|nr:hypothetical protein [Lachnospiraceae bacterium]